jgi:predicted ArsR family transcriptional regulator
MGIGRRPSLKRPALALARRKKALELLVECKSLPAIAAALDISVQSVRKHLRKALETESLSRQALMPTRSDSFARSNFGKRPDRLLMRSSRESAQRAKRSLGQLADVESVIVVEARYDLLVVFKQTRSSPRPKSNAGPTKNPSSS